MIGWTRGENVVGAIELEIQLQESDFEESFMMIINF